MVDAPFTPTPQPQPTLTGSIPFYSKPEPLSPEKHGKLALKKVDHPLAFAHAANVVPITVGEFGPAALSYPIIFTGEARAPLVVMGLRQGENLFIGPDGQVDADAYVPAFVRRYPFVFAEDKSADRFVVCIDAESSLLSPSGETPLFADGKPTEYTNGAIEFLKSFEQQRTMTNQMVQVLREHDLLELKEANFTPANPDGSPAQTVKLAEYFAVSLEKVAALSHGDLAKLRDNGMISVIYAHHLSLLNWQKLVNRMMRQSAQAAPAAIN